MPNVEHRSLQIRAAQGEEFVLQGRALPYNQISSNELYPGVRERIVAGAFKESLASGRDVHAYLNHQSKGLPLGRLGNGTLKVTDSAEGLDFRVQLDKNNQQHRDVYASVKRGDISECSFAFTSDDEDFSNETYQGKPCQVRNVRKAKLYDLSVVCEPFYGDGATNVDARSTDEAFRASMRARLTAIDEKYTADIWRIQAEARAKKLARDMADPLDSDAAKDQVADARELQLIQDSLNKANPKYSVIGKSDSHVYGVASDDDDSVHRWAYSRDNDGTPCVDHDSHTVLGDVEEVDSRAFWRAKLVLRERRADAALKFRMDVAAGRR